MEKKSTSFTKLFTFLAFIFFIMSIVSFEITSSGLTGAKETITKSAEKKKDADVYEMLELFGKAFEITKERYVEDVENKKLIEGAIDGMLSKLDPHSSFLNDDDFNDMNEQTSGSFGGLGIEVTMDKGVIKVISPLDDTPAYKAGIEAGDLITHIDDVQVQGLTLTEAIKKMKGRPGTKVKLKVFREKKEPFDVEIVRDIIRTEPVKSKIKSDTVAYIRLSTFNENSYNDMANAIKNLQKENPKIVGYVLDLRNNTGGLLDQAVKISDAFISSGEIVSIMSRQKDTSRVFFASEGDIIDGKPLVVIINGASASAAEIVAGALQDHRRAVLIGTKSYGKGSVQTLIPLGNSALKLTTARYYTPSGRSIQADGIEPDILVNRAKVEEVAEDRMFAESTLTNALKNDTTTKKLSKKEQAKQERKAQEEERDKNDYQMIRAVDLVRALAVYENRSKPALKNDSVNTKSNTKGNVKTETKTENKTDKKSKATQKKK